MANRYVVVVVCCSLFGCPPQSGDDAGISVPTALAFCERYTGPEYACDYLMACGVFSARDACLTYMRAQNGDLDCSQVDFVKMVNDGFTRYDATEGAKCISEFSTACRPDTATCRKVMSGTKKEGDDCRRSSCEVGFYCASDGGCPGTCAARKPAGSLVYVDDACIESTRSHFTLPDGGSGQNCQTPAIEGQSCATAPCAEGLYCSSEKKCTKLSEVGEKCSSSSECIPHFGVACQPGADGGDLRCGKLANRGELCGNCRQDLRCVITVGKTLGVCGDIGTAGQPCRHSGECGSGLYCNGTSKLCESPRALGAACENYAECQFGLRCEFELPKDGGFTPEYYCRTYDAGVYVPNYCPSTEGP